MDATRLASARQATRRGSMTHTGRLGLAPASSHAGTRVDLPDPVGAETTTGPARNASSNAGRRDSMGRRSEDTRSYSTQPQRSGPSVLPPERSVAE